jgi:hypothetical protein
MKRAVDGFLTLCVVGTSSILLLWPGSDAGMLVVRLVTCVSWFIVVANYAEFGEGGSHVIHMVCAICAPLLFVTSLVSQVAPTNSWTQSGIVLAGVACTVTASGLLRQAAIKSGSSSIGAWLLMIGAFAGAVAPSLDAESPIYVGLIVSVAAIVVVAAVLPRRRRVLIH